MVWLDICDEQGNAIYFDIHHVERKRIGRQWRHAVNGVCGNGLYEMEVLVEPGEKSEVTYVDLSAGADYRNRLLAGIDSCSLESGLIDAAMVHCGLANRRPEPAASIPHPLQKGALLIQEPDAEWQTA